MTLRWWYLRRGVPWLAVLGCCAAAGMLAGLLARWPASAVVLLPAVLACCAAAATFVFDERAVMVVTVTPRGAGWRRTARLAVALVPLGVWAVVVLVHPGDLPLDRGGWLLLGLAGVSLSVAAASLASRWEVPAPGAMLAPVVALAVIAPVIVSAFLGLDSIYPIGDFPQGVWVFWLVMALTGATVHACASGRGRLLGGAPLRTPRSAAPAQGRAPRPR